MPASLKLSPTEEAGLRRLIATQAVAQSLSVHSRGVDRADQNLLSSAYHPHATVDYGFFSGSASEMVEILCAAQRTGEVTLHRTCNMWIAVDGDEARSESYVFAYAETADPEGNTQRLIGGRYLDTHACLDGQWRLTHRQYVMDWNINWLSTAAWSEPPLSLFEARPRGGHGEADAGRALLTFAAARTAATGGVSTMSEISHEDIDRALSRQAIHDLIMACARGVDRADAELLSTLFHEDSTVVTGAVNGSGPQFAREIVDLVSNNLDRSFHSVANEWLQVQGDRAIGESYVVAVVTAAGQDTITGGRYVDEFERRDGQWKFLSHTFVCDYTITQPTSFQDYGMYEALKTRGCYGREDPVYRFWK